MQRVLETLNNTLKLAITLQMVSNAEVQFFLQILVLEYFITSRDKSLWVELES